MWPGFTLISRGTTTLGWSHDGVPLPAEDNPKNVFNRLFGVEKDGIDVQRRRLNRHHSVLDVVLDDARNFRKALGSEDRGKLDEYLHAVREVEVRTERLDSWLNVPKPKVDPATTANLGPAFDRLAMAVDLRCTVTAEVSDEWAIEHIGPIRPEGPSDDGVLAAARLAVGDRALKLTVETAIPMAKGLGSSSAAYVAGAAAAIRAVGEEASPDHVFRLASQLDGHPDQAAAAVFGGLVLVPAEGMPLRLPLHPSLRPIIAIPTTSLATSKARTKPARAAASSFSPSTADSSCATTTAPPSVSRAASTACGGSAATTSSVIAPR